MRVLAVDDEPLALSVIETFAKQIGVIESIMLKTSAVEALEFIQSNKVDLIYLDINMPYLSGIEFAKLIPPSTMVIFTTAYEQYALTGFDLAAVDYIVKPFSFNRFLKATMKANELYMLKNAESNNIQITQNEQSILSDNTQEDYLMIKVEYATVKVKIENIQCIEGLKDYVKIFTSAKNYVTKSTMKNVEERLPTDMFMRVHKSYIINLEKMSAFENNTITIDDLKIPLSNGYRDSFVSFLDKYKL